ncbi:MAG: hypothetical protein KDC39_09770 [Actinobacteria bacterium]|nr:hypothetical protein [Actinomycetota bacterium]
MSQQYSKDIGKAQGSRPDVAAAYPGYGDRHGYANVINLPMYGNVTVDVYAINIGPGGNKHLGRKTIHVAPTPEPTLPTKPAPRPRPTTPANPNPRQPTDPNPTAPGTGTPEPSLTQMVVKAKGVKKRSNLRINVNPNQASKSYKVKVFKKVRGEWKRVRILRTRGTRDVVTVNQPKGKYKVKDPRQHGLNGGRSRQVRLLR